jgi:hypothetical protein
MDAAQLAEEAARAGERLVKALETENKLKRSRGEVGRDEVRAVQQAVDKCTQDYLNAVRRYVQFFQRATREDD